jgi:hypothetical protein
VRVGELFSAVSLRNNFRSEEWIAAVLLEHFVQIKPKKLFPLPISPKVRMQFLEQGASPMELTADAISPEPKQIV